MIPQGPIGTDRVATISRRLLPAWISTFTENRSPGLPATSVHDSGRTRINKSPGIAGLASHAGENSREKV
jgi:hypothetical protein